MPEIALEGVSMQYPDALALDDLDLYVRDREFLVAIGPSGSGKTTLLRVIAGLEKQTAGRVSIGGKRVDGVAPSRRGLALLSQEMALYPHLSARGNLEFPLKVRHEDAQVVAARVDAIARELRMTRLLDKTPEQLSTGERQAVATGRAVVGAPPIVLLDEPFAQVDAGARRRLRTQLRGLREVQAATVVLATNDQETAMSLADRLAVLDAGRLQQLAPPRQVYDRPANTFVAGFLGAMNLMWGELTATAGSAVELRLGSRSITLPDEVVPGRFVGRPVIVGIRPEALRYGSVRPRGGPEQRLGGTVVSAEFQGREQLVHLLTDIAGIGGGEAELQARLPADVALTAGSHLALAFDPARLRFFNPADGWGVVG